MASLRPRLVESASIRCGSILDMAALSASLPEDPSCSCEAASVWAIAAFISSMRSAMARKPLMAAVT